MINLDTNIEWEKLILELNYSFYKIKMYYDEGMNSFVQVIIKLYIPESIIGGKEQKDIKCIRIEEEYFRNIYEKFCGINFENIAMDNTVGCDGYWFNLKIGLENYFVILSLWSPTKINDDDTEINKFFNVCEEIDKKIDGYRWFEKIKRENKDCTPVELHNIVVLSESGRSFLNISNSENIPMDRLKKILEWNDI